MASSTILTRSSTKKCSTRNEDKKNLIPEDTDPRLESRKESAFSKVRNVQKTPTKHKTSPESESDHLNSVTPPKQRRNHARNAESGKTPNSLLKSLSLTSPVKQSRSRCSKKSLFQANNAHEDGIVTIDLEEYFQKVENSEGGKQPEKPTSQYQNARRALHSQSPIEMPGREKEIAEIRNFIQDHIENGTSGSIYISGPPGTGKTASLNLILEQKNISSLVQNIYINCTAIKSATAVYSRLNKELSIKVNGKSEKDNLSAFETYLRKKHKPILIVLDEIDQLESKNHSILYTIFEWPSRLQSKIILIGIANALDLTDRTLPRLQARCELKPKLLHFAPYTKEQIIHIFTSRLKEAGVFEVFSPVAIQMLAGKVASISGDVRRALDIGRRVVELIDDNKVSDILKSVENFTNELKPIENNTMKKVNLQEVVSVLNNVYGTTQNLSEDSEEAFPLQQKIIICTLLLMRRKAKNKDITIGRLHEVYSRVCNKRNVTAVDQAEFSGLCALIETRGIIRVTRKKEPRMHKVSLEWNDKEVSDALKDKQLMSTILDDESCLGKV